MAFTIIDLQNRFLRFADVFEFSFHGSDKKSKDFTRAF